MVSYLRLCGKYAHSYAMMQEIAPKGGNFCGVCPVIGRLNCFCFAGVYRRGRRMVGACRPIFMARSDTHGSVNTSSTVPRRYAN